MIITEFDHYKPNNGKTNELLNLSETPPTIKNIGWTLGNDCPYRCRHCYSLNAREKGANMTPKMIDRIVNQLVMNNIETVNLGGNEPLFTNGARAKDSLLPYIIEMLYKNNIKVGLTTSGVSLIYLNRFFPESVNYLNDCDVSFDSPFFHEHNSNRGANVYGDAIKALEICKEASLPHTIIMAAMSWNFSDSHIEELVKMARKYEAHVRINPLKPTMLDHLNIALKPEDYYRGFKKLLELCDPVDLGEPPLASITNYIGGMRCPCGRTSFRIHSITPNGKIYISPCVYTHDYKSEYDILEYDLIDIINSPQFKLFRRRHANPKKVEGCASCNLVDLCGGGCAGRAYLYNLLNTGNSAFFKKDPFCPKDFDIGDFPRINKIKNKYHLVHMDYLCTWIGYPKDM